MLLCGNIRTEFADGWQHRLDAVVHLRVDEHGVLFVDQHRQRDVMSEGGARGE
jgi:hypothetical protein